jgi:hypothetical protein
MNALFPVGLVLFAFGCASAPLTEQERSVRILRKSDPPANCKELEKVHAPGVMSVTEQGREEDLKRATAKVGGDTVTIDSRDANNTVFGTAYKCSS